MAILLEQHTQVERLERLLEALKGKTQRNDRGKARV